MPDEASTPPDSTSSPQADDTQAPPPKSEDTSGQAPQSGDTATGQASKPVTPPAAEPATTATSPEAAQPSSGGLVRAERDATIKLANANVSIISSLLTNTGEHITYWETILGYLESHPTYFLGEGDFHKIREPESLKAELEEIKKSLSEHLEEVMSPL